MFTVVVAVLPSESVTCTVSITVVVAPARYRPLVWFIAPPDGLTEMTHL